MRTPLTLWHNAVFYTLDPVQPRVQALVSADEKILFAGSFEEARKVAGPWAQSVNLKGKAVVPGFNDNHLHLVFFGDHSLVPDLSGLNENQIVDTLVAFYSKLPSSHPVVGYAWDYTHCPHPRKELLDEAFGDRLVFLPQFGGHAVWVSSRVLRELGVTKFTAPPQGQILRDDEGEPTGILQEFHPNPVQDRYFHEIFFNPRMREARVRRSLDALRRLGITSVQDNTWYYPELFTLAKLRRRKELTARVSAWSFGRLPKTIPWMALGSYDKRWLRRGPWKYFLDGTFTTRTAWMEEAYPGTPHNYGLSFDKSWLKEVLTNLAKRRVQGAFHSIGDRSTRTFLDVWEDVLQAYPEAVHLRMRLEHVQALRREDLPRLKALGVCVAAQPPAMVNPDKDASIVGAARVPTLYPHRSLLEAGVPLSFGSDIPGESFCDPLLGIHLVCNRSGPESLTPEQALACYTQGSAYVEFQESQKGSLEAGKLADFAVLSADLLTLPVDEIRNIQVVRTVVGGRTVWEKV
ncbi:MAG: amidohydrolase [Spirochaetales bacterium]|nr:amidohydrolase [Spirochaetales bacterium]